MQARIEEVRAHLRNPTTPEAIVAIIGLMDGVATAEDYEALYQALIEVSTQLGLRIAKLSTPEQLLQYFTETDLNLQDLCKQLIECHSTVSAQNPRLPHPSIITKSITTTVIDFAMIHLNNQELLMKLVDAACYAALPAIPHSLLRWTLQFSASKVNSQTAISQIQTDVTAALNTYVFNMAESFSTDFLKSKDALRDHLSLMGRQLTALLPQVAHGDENHRNECKTHLSRIQSRIQILNKPKLKTPKLSESTLTQFRPAPVSVSPDYSQYRNINTLIFDFDDTIYELEKYKQGIITDPLKAVDAKTIALIQFAHEYLPISILIHTARNQAFDNADYWAKTNKKGGVKVSPASNFRIPPVLRFNELSHIFTPDKILYSDYQQVIIHPDGAVQLQANAFNVRSKRPRFDQYLVSAMVKADQVAVFDDSLSAWTKGNSEEFRDLPEGILFHHIDNEHPVRNIITATKNALIGIMMHNEDIALDKRKAAAEAFVTLCDANKLIIADSFREFARSATQKVSKAV